MNAPAAGSATIRSTSSAARPANTRTLVLLRWILLAAWREQPARTAIAIVSIAIGVATALSIELVHRSALAEVGSALARIDGQADARIEARGASLDEALYFRMAAAEPGIVASPVIDARLALVDSPEARLRVLGIDVFRALEVSPALVPVPADGEATGADSPLFADDAIFLSTAALAAFGLHVGEEIRLNADGRAVTLRIAGTVPGAGHGQRLAVMDLGTMQWRLGWLGRLSRIDLRAIGQDTGDAGVDTLAGVRARWHERIDTQAYWTTPQAGSERAALASRAYRVNLNALALVAWFTGAFIVWSTLALAITRQQPTIAILEALGARRRWTLQFALAHGLVIGTTGTIIGLIVGVGAAGSLLGHFGGDLGAGYFSSALSSSSPRLRTDPALMAAFALAGVATGVLGAILPVWRQRHRATAWRLRHPADPEARAGSPVTAIRLALAASAAGALLLWAPVTGEIPWTAWIAMACWIIAAIAALVPIVRFVTVCLRRTAGERARATGWLAIERLAGTPRTAAAAIAPIVASFALATAMIIMIASFRVSFTDWLDVTLPADAYGLIPGNPAPAGIDTAMQQAIAATPGVALAQFSRAVPWTIDPARPPATLLVRALASTRTKGGPAAKLPTIGPVQTAPPGTIGVYASEAMADLYGFTPGTRITRVLPLDPEARDRSGTAATNRTDPLPANDGEDPWAGPDAGSADAAGRPVLFVVGLVRDYGRQHGSVLIDVADWKRLGGDERASNVAVWFTERDETERTAAASKPADRPDSGRADTGPWRALRAATASLTGFEWRDSGTIRRGALHIFDRSFAVTDALEVIAIAVALFGAAAVWAGEGLARRREFATLLHLGLTRGGIARSFTLEAALQLLIALVWGMLIGILIALVLVYRVNPQSFHWTMDLHWPVRQLLAAAVGLFAFGTLTARWTVRGALTHPERTLRAQT